MRVNMDKLRGLMKEHHVTITDLCKSLGMNPSTFYRKANTTNGESFTIGNMHTIVDCVGMTKEEAIAVFLH